MEFVDNLAYRRVDSVLWNPLARTDSWNLSGTDNCHCRILQYTLHSWFARFEVQVARIRTQLCVGVHRDIEQTQNTLLQL